jgi:hypothetical protein
VEITTEVPMKWHKHFVARGAVVLREIQDQNGGVSISFPRQNAQDTKVVIKGGKDCVEGAKQRIAEIVSDLVCHLLRFIYSYFNVIPALLYENNRAVTGTGNSPSPTFDFSPSLFEKVIMLVCACLTVCLNLSLCLCID